MNEEILQRIQVVRESWDKVPQKFIEESREYLSSRKTEYECWLEYELAQSQERERKLHLEISEYGLPIVWLARWSWYGGKALGHCIFSTKREAIKYAIFQAKSYIDWSKFPDPSKGSYPYEERNGSITRLTPVFRAIWDGGYSEVERVDVESKFHAADYAQKQVEEIYNKLIEASQAYMEAPCQNK